MASYSLGERRKGMITYQYEHGRRAPSDTQASQRKLGRDVRATCSEIKQLKARMCRRLRGKVSLKLSEAIRVERDYVRALLAVAECGSATPRRDTDCRSKA